MNNNSNIYVYDFDGTLINVDSIKEYYIYCWKNKKINSKKIIFFTFLIILSKLKIISVKKEKELALKFIFNNSYEEFSENITLFLNHLKKYLNNFYYDAVQKSMLGHTVFIVSGSFHEFLEPIFPNQIKLIGTKINRHGDNILNIDQHPFKHEKANLLRKSGINCIDYFFTDSLNDTPLVNISKVTTYIKNGAIVKKIYN